MAATSKNTPSGREENNENEQPAGDVRAEVLSMIQQVLGDDYTDVSPESMIMEQQRFDSYDNWPIDEQASCVPKRLAEAGWFHTPTAESPDAVRCFCCLKDLEGWDADDDPWTEHRDHSPDCVFVQIGKPIDELNVEDFLRVAAHRDVMIMAKLMDRLRKRVHTSTGELKDRLKGLQNSRAK